VFRLFYMRCECPKITKPFVKPKDSRHAGCKQQALKCLTQMVDGGEQGRHWHRASAGRVTLCCCSVRFCRTGDRVKCVVGEKTKAECRHNNADAILKFLNAHAPLSGSLRPQTRDLQPPSRTT
jgi:hypothetical protein